MRIVLDANVIVSAVITPNGNAAEILYLWEQDRFDLVISTAILEEVQRVCHYPKIKEKYKLTDEKIRQAIMLLATAIIVKPAETLSIVQKEPTNNRYLECAISGGASYVITGDIHLLELKEFQGIVILPPAGFLTLLSQADLQ